MKKAVWIKALSLALCAFLLVPATACGEKDTGDLDDTNPNKKVTVKFWSGCGQDEKAVFDKLVEKFNASNEYNITVKHENQPWNGYVGNMDLTLRGSTGPDVFYVADGDIRKWARLGYLTDLSAFAAESEETGALNFDDFWPSAMQRYRYDVEKMTSDDDDPLYGLPKDIGPTVLYYNADHFKNQGIQLISVYEKDLAAYNAANGKSYAPRGYDPVSKVFNNKIPMTWEESIALARLFTKKFNSSSPSTYGYFTEWWFSYCWSVGGDCVEYNEETGYYEFSLGDTTVRKNAAGQDMPTTREAFEEFVKLSMAEADGGYEIAPTQQSLNDVGKDNYFTTGKVAMMVDLRSAIVNYRKNMRYDWDCAPLPKAATGVEAGHSGSMALSIWSKSRKAKAAYKFIEFIAGPEGQAAQAETGFNIPNQMSMANTDVFLQPDAKPKNAEIFLSAAALQKPGDWTYMPDNTWIEYWAPVLNDDVRNGRKTFEQFFAEVTDHTNELLRAYKL